MIMIEDCLEPENFPKTKKKNEGMERFQIQFHVTVQ